MISRLNHVFELLPTYHLDALVLNPGPSLAYLTGLQFHLMERPTLAIFTAEGRLGLVMPELEKEKLKDVPVAVEGYLFGDDPATWPAVFAEAFGALLKPGARVAVEPTRLRYLEMSHMRSERGTFELVDGSELLASIRMVKDADELDRMRHAARIAQQALLETLPTVRVGMTEKEIASELVIQLFRAGSDVELPFQPIISSGPNSANPHASPSERRLALGDLLLFDWGAAYEGYFSDITRTFTVGRVDAELERVGRLVVAANSRGREFGRAGLTAGSLDQAVREVIAQGGYGPYFTHRTGHGLGMEAHEPPYIFGGNPFELQPGMTFTIEPGIYLPGRGGVRVEDDVVVLPDGLESLTNLPRDVLPLEAFWK